MATRSLYAGEDTNTGDPIMVEYYHQYIWPVCAVCGLETRRRVLRRDFDIQDGFITWPWTDHYTPSEMYRHCPDCGKETTHLTHTVG